MNSTTPFEDMTDDLSFDNNAPATQVDISAASQRWRTAGADATVYREPCKRCSGSGRFFGYSGRYVGPCNACKGAGTLAYRTPADQREKARVAAAERKDRVRRETFEAFSEAHPEAARWIAAKQDTFDFARSMRDAIERFGDLTERQLAAVERCAANDAARTAARAAEAANAKHLTNLHTVMQRHAKFYAGEVTLSRRNADQLVWVKHANAEKVVGKIDNGVLTLWSRPGVDMAALRCVLDEFEGAPLQAAMKYGKLTGRCCSCGRELTDDTSIANGIGPICAGKFEGL